MTKKTLSGLQQNIIAIVAICSFIIMGSMHNTGSITEPLNNTGSCNFGYSLKVNDVRQFMLDSLGTRQYEGGLFSRNDLRRVLDSMRSDSIYILNGMFGCDFNRGTGLAITSPRNINVAFLGWYAVGYCYPCPIRACCPKKFCVINTQRNTASYLVYNPFDGISSTAAILEANQ